MTAPPPGPRGRYAAQEGRPRVRLSVRVRVLAAVLVMCALGLTAAGAVANAVQTARISDAVDHALSQEVEEFRALASRGVDPDSGRPFTSVEQLLLTALQQNVPSPNEVFLTFRDGQADRYLAGDLPQLVTDPAVRAAVAGVPADATTVERREVETAIGRVRLSVVPVRVEGAQRAGTYVVAFAFDRELDAQNQLMRTYALVALGSLVLIGVVGWLVAGRLLRPLRSLSEATQRISETDLRQRVQVTGRDDVSELARTFNAMLDRLEDAFEAQRQFIDDAGHELKTPVTILRGHLELLDPGSPGEVAETRSLLLDEIDRMNRLVDDLILLAKAERVDFVQPAPVQLDRLTDEVLDKARGLGDRDWRVDARADAVVDADPQRLTQALLQLADNAVKFTEPGTTVALGSSADDDTVRIWVRDEGPGVAPADVERIFDRFGRADTGRGVEGSGLGLSIVRAIAEAHHGHVEAAPGERRGVTFTIVLPRSRRGPRAPAQTEPVPALEATP